LARPTGYWDRVSDDMSAHWGSAKSDISIYTKLGSKPVDRQARQAATGDIEDPQSRKARDPLNGQTFSKLDFQV